MLGVDGCPGGWIGARVDGSAVTWLLLEDAAAVFAVDAATMAIDIPIGLPERGWRACDLEAKELLGRAASSVFLTPPRPVLEAQDYAAARTLARELTGGQSVSAQAYALRHRILDVDRHMTPDLESRVVEVHPELALRTLGRREPGTKHSAAGLAARIGVLQGWLPDVLGDLERVPRRVRLDDALDALAAAWSAQRWAAGTARTVPTTVHRDPRGLRMQIAY